MYTYRRAYCPFVIGFNSVQHKNLYTPPIRRLSTLASRILSNPPSMTTNDIFLDKSITLVSKVGLCEIGIANIGNEEVVAAISNLLVRSISDARQSNAAGHLPDHIVDAVITNFISPIKIKTLWADYGKRFIMVSEQKEIIGTVHVASSPDIILYRNRDSNNVLAADFPGVKPKGYHQIMNLCVKHEYRRKELGKLLICSIDRHFGALFQGKGLWMRGDPPWHNKLKGLGFIHDPSMDSFLEAEAEKTLELPHSEYNKIYACSCVHPHPEKPERLLMRQNLLETQKLQYFSFTYDFRSKT